MIKVSGLKSLYSPANARTVYILFKGSPLEITDTLCSCHGDLRTIGGCAHAIAILIKLGQILGNIEPRQQTISEQILKRGRLVQRPQDSSGSEDESSSSDSDSSASDDD